MFTFRGQPFFNTEGAGGSAENVQDVVNDVVDALNKESDTDEEVEEKNEEPVEESKDESKDEKKDELSDEQKSHAFNLFKALSDPATAKASLEALATLGGFELKQKEEKARENKEEKKEGAKSVLDIVKARLGSKYQIFAEDLGQTLEEVFSSVGLKEAQEFRSRFEAQEQDTLKAQVSKAFETVQSSYDKVDPKILQEITRMQQEGELPFNPKIKPEVYFKTAFTLASQNIGVPLNLKQKEEKKEGQQKTPAAKTAARINKISGEEKGTGSSSLRKQKTLDDVLAEVIKDVMSKE